MQYFYLIPFERFQKRLVPALASSWKRRNFHEIIDLYRQSAGEKGLRLDNVQQLSSQLQLASESRLFRPDIWLIVVAEALLAASAELPEIETPLESWARLLGQDLAETRPKYAPIQKAVLGSLDLFLGCYYRPENAGWNDFSDVREFAGWLRKVQAETWRPEFLTHIPSEDREEELAYAKEWFGLFTAMYDRAEQAEYVVVCERI
jgi:hypothetical protein